MDKVIIYTDGSCHGNPGPGGWAAILLHRSGIRQVTGCDCWTTNGRMELKAIVEALKSLNESCDVCIRSDSKWIVDAINRGQRYLTTFTHSKNRKHADLWGEILRLSHKHMIRAEWVKGHAHDNYNNLAISNIDFKEVNVEVRGSTNNINSVENSDIEVYFIMPQEPGTYNLELFAEIKNNPFVDISLERSTVNVTVVEANQ